VPRSTALVLRAILSVALIVWLILRADLPSVAAALADVVWFWFVAAVLLHVSGVFLTAWRWGILLGAQGLNVPVLYLARSYLIASFFNYFLPTSVGGDVYRAYDIGTQTGKPERALGVLLVERVSGLFTLVLLAILATPWAARVFGSLPLTMAPIALGVLFLLGALLLFWDSFVRQAGRVFDLPLLARLKHRVREVHEAIVAFRHHKQAFGFAFLVGLLLQLNFVVHHYFLARALGIEVSLGTFLFLVPLISVLLLLPASINGIGLRENAFVLLLGRLGVTNEASVAFCALLLAAMVLFGIAGGIVYAISGQNRRKIVEQR
jgi:uncharacterized protein (TIRG00374 family)